MMRTPSRFKSSVWLNGWMWCSASSLRQRLVAADPFGCFFFLAAMGAVAPFGVLPDRIAKRGENRSADGVFCVPPFRVPLHAEQECLGSVHADRFDGAVGSARLDP